MTDRKISVIVPVYNSGPFLLETLDSLACQSFRDYEVILVDDGSTDESPRIIDDVCARSKRFRALHTKNGGAYKARLLGIREAKGEYIAFCDSDDLYDPDTLEKLFLRAKTTGADITFCGFVREEMKTGRLCSPEMITFGNRVYAHPELTDILPRIAGSMNHKLFRRELLGHALILENPPRISEDLLFLCSLYPFIQKIAFLPEALYRYRIRAGSAISHVTAKDRDRILNNMLLTRAYVFREDDSPEMRYVMDCVAFVQIGVWQVIVMTNSGENYLRTLRFAKRWLDRHAPGYKQAGHSLSWNRAHDNVQLRILLERWLFGTPLMRPAFRAYDLIIRTGRIRFPW